MSLSEEMPNVVIFFSSATAVIKKMNLEILL